MADKTVRGQFVWHELSTPDAGAAHAFYSKTLGWTTQPFEHDPSYSMFAAASGPLGGSVQSSEGAPHWLPYIGTPDIDATVEQVTRAGGRVKKEPTSIPNGGKYAILTDPEGATFGVYASTEPHAKESPPKRGEYSWHELAANDLNAAFSFYSSVFGWDKMQEHDMGPELGKYLIFGRNGTQLGGMYARGNMPGPAWLGYVRVKDVNQTVKKVKSAGGTLLNGPMEVPGGDWIAQFTDPHGAMFAVHTLAADVQKPAQAAAPQAAASASEASPAEKKAPAKKAAPTEKKAPAKKAAPTEKKAPAEKAASAEKRAPAKKAVPQAAQKPAAKKAAQKAAKKPANRAGGKAAKKSAKTSAKKKGTAARGARRPAKSSRKTAAKKGGSKSKRSGGKRKSARRPRKGK